MYHRQRGLETWGLLFAIGVSLAGCDSSVEQSGYQTFESLPEVEQTAASDQSQSDEPEDVNVVLETTQSQASFENPVLKDVPPLIAIRPVLADSAESIKDNIDNASTVGSTEREIKLLVPDKTFNHEGPENSLRVSYDDFDLLKILNMEPVPLDAVDHFPKWLATLDGKKVRVRGFMYPPFKEEGLEQFILARDNQICCFGKNPKIYDLVYVSMRDGVTASYIQNRPFDVVGTFRIRPDAEDGEWFSLYQLEDSIVIDR